MRYAIVDEKDGGHGNYKWHPIGCHFGFLKWRPFIVSLEIEPNLELKILDYLAQIQNYKWIPNIQIGHHKCSFFFMCSPSCLFRVFSHLYQLCLIKQSFVCCVLNCLLFECCVQLLQLLLKASQDKKFVCEEADKTLHSMVQSLSPLPLLQSLQKYARHNNPRIRAKAAVSISNCVSRMVT